MYIVRKLYVVFFCFLFFVLHANECTVIHKANPKSLRNSVNFQEQMCSLFVSFIVNHVQFDFYIYTSFSIL